MVELKQWYKTRRGSICRVELLHPNGCATVTSHYTGNKVKVYPDEIEYFVKVDEPDTPPGTALRIIKDENENQDEYFGLYKQYRHLIPGSIYKVNMVFNRGDKHEVFKVDGKIRVKCVKAKIKGSTRCKIQCQARGCHNTRDIKVQDLFQVTMCEDCKKKERRRKLKEFLAAKRKKASKS